MLRFLTALLTVITLLASPTAWAKEQNKRLHTPAATSRIVAETDVIYSLKRAIKQYLPNESITVERVNKSVALSGKVMNAEAALTAEKLAKEFIGQDNVLNFLQVKTSQQVMLRVRVGEIQRTALKKLGPGLTVPLVALEFLEKNGMFKTLAEPNLTAISGESAEFLAGGEIPVPSAQANDTISVTYKPVGVRVNFTPYVLSQSRIRLNVAPEVSEVSPMGSVSVKGYSIPSITSRRAKTTVELAPGESFMIAGLLKDNFSVNAKQLPALGDIPVLGALFRSSAFQRNETELVIAVTPYLVDPMANNDVRLPTDNLHTPSNSETVFFGSLGAKSTTDAQGSRVEGPVGYIAE